MQFPPPPEVLATWPPPNYDNPESRGPALLIIDLITLLIALLALLGRLYVKFALLRKPGWDDHLMILAALFGIGLTLTVILANTLYGWDHHIWDLTFDSLVTARKVSLAAQFCYLFASSLAKISILISYINLLAATSQSRLRLVSQLTIALIVVGNISIFVVVFAQCTPVSSYWDISRVSADCHIREGHFLMAQAGVNVVADLIVWILPLPTLYRARLPLRQRLGLIVLFSFGAVVVIAAALRTYWLWWAVIVTWDMTWECRDEWIWTAVEVHLGIMCGCVPWMRSLVNLSKKMNNASTKLASGGDGGSHGVEMMTSNTVGGGTIRPSGGGVGCTGTSTGTYSCTVGDVEMTTTRLGAQQQQQWWDNDKYNRDDSDGSDLVFQRHEDSGNLK